MFRSLILAGLAVLALAAPSRAQTVTNAVPDAASPGDLVILRGSGLAGVTSVDFHGIVGGFVGTWTVSVAPLSASDTEVQVLVPVFGNFIPPDGQTGGDPLGSLGLNGGPPVADFFLMEGSGGQLATLGTGSTQPGGLGKPVISFVLKDGPPAPGNANCKLLLENATPGASALLLAGLPAMPPYGIFSGGTLIVNTSGPFLLLGPAAIGAGGEALLALPIPATVGITVALQWGFKHPVTHAVLLSNALLAQL